MTVGVSRQTRTSCASTHALAMHAVERNRRLAAAALGYDVPAGCDYGLAAAGEPEINQKLLNGYKAGAKTFKVHIDGFNMVPYITGEVKESPRDFFFYVSDDGDVLGVRLDNWKIVFMEQRCPGTLQVWAEPFVRLRVPKLFNLRTDPYEFADITSNSYYDWFLYHAYFLMIGQTAMGKFVETFKEFPPVQKPNTFTIDDAMRKMEEAAGGAGH